MHTDERKAAGSRETWVQTITIIVTVLGLATFASQSLDHRLSTLTSEVGDIRQCLGKVEGRLDGVVGRLDSMDLNNKHYLEVYQQSLDAYSVSLNQFKQSFVRFENMMDQYKGLMDRRASEMQELVNAEKETVLDFKQHLDMLNKMNKVVMAMGEKTEKTEKLSEQLAALRESLLKVVQNLALICVDQNQKRFFLDIAKGLQAG